MVGGYYLFFTSPSESDFARPDQGSGELNRFIRDVAASLSKENLLEASTYIAARAREEWTNAPFLRSEMSAKYEAESDRVEAPALDKSLTYSGYIQIGDYSLAIINGIEYEAGDEIERGGYMIKSISPTRVVVGPAGDVNNIILPLEESKTLEENHGDSDRSP